MEQTTWYNCYDESWKGVISDDSFTHPAKFSRALIRRIYEYCLEQGYLRPGSTVVDPFGGVGLGALYALANGINWIGVELEEKFVRFGNGYECAEGCDTCRTQPQAGPADGQLTLFDSFQAPTLTYHPGNLDLFRPYARHGAKAVLLQGDSRNLARTIRQALIDGVIGSPPFSGNSGGRGEASRHGIDAALFDRHAGGMVKGLSDQPGNLAAMPMSDGDFADAVIGSPPFGQAETRNRTPHSDGHVGSMMTRAYTQDKQGADPANLAHLSEGNLDTIIDAVIGSPPFVESVGSDDPAKRGGILISDPKRAGDKNLTGTYGNAEGQLGAMRAGEFDGVIGSPPFESVEGFRDKEFSDQWGPKQSRTTTPQGYGSTPGQLGAMTGGFEAAIGSPPYESRTVHGHVGIDLDKLTGNPGKRNQAVTMDNYGESPENLGNSTGDTFWAAAKTIVEQCYQVLAPGAVAVWVCKDFVRKGQRVPFSDMWRRLNESAGFEHVETIRAMLVKEHGARVTLEGEVKPVKVERKSFFRRLAERNGSPRIDHEDIVVMRKPL